MNTFYHHRYSSDFLLELNKYARVPAYSDFAVVVALPVDSALLGIKIDCYIVYVLLL